MKKVFAIFIVLTMIVALASCVNTGSEKITIGISVPGNSLERFNRDAQYLKNQFEAAGYNVNLKFVNDDNEQQNKDIQDMISKGVKMLIILAVDSNGLSQTLAEAKNKNIPVVAYDRFINNSDAVTVFVSFDNYAVGTLQGNYIKKALDLDNAEGPFNIEFTAGNPGDTNAKYYYQGAIDVLQPYLDSGKLVVPSAQKSFEQVATDQWSTEKAKSRFESILDTFYDEKTVLNAVVCSNDSSALGVTQAIDAKYKGDNTPIITGQDGDIANLRNLVDGVQAMTVYKNVSDEAKAAFEVSRAILEKKSIDSKLVESFSVKTIFDNKTYNNGKEGVSSYLLVPIEITADNLDVLVGTGLYKWDTNHKYIETVDVK